MASKSRGDDRRTVVADAAIAVLADAGARGLTHRAVDAAAGLPIGSTSYYFRTREALLVAAVHRLADLDLAPAGVGAERAEAEQHSSRGSAPVIPRDVDALVRMLTRQTYLAYSEQRERTLARYELSLAARRYPEVQAALAAMGERFVAVGTAALAALGSRHPARDAHAIIAVCAGFQYESIVGGQRPYTRAEIRAVLRDLLAARLPG